MTPATHKVVKWPTLILLLTLLVACVDNPRPAAQEAFATIVQRPAVSLSPAVGSPGQRALDIARTLLGTPYRYGGTDPNGFDCSGLVQYVFSHVGRTLPRTSREIFHISQRISPQELQPGDLVFFTISSNKISHVGIYADHKRFIHSPSSGKGVSYASMENPYWQKRLVGVGRF